MPSFYDQGPNGKRKRIEISKTSLESDRSSFLSHWQEIASFMLPRRTRFSASDRNKGDKRNQNIINSTARYSIRTLQSGMHAGMSSPARPWFKLTTPDPDLAKFPAVKAWLHDVTQRMLDLFQQVNIYNTLPIVYGDLGVFGTAAMAVLDDNRDLFRTYAYPVGSYVLGLDARGNAATFIRDYELSVRQVVEQFGVRTGYRDIDWSSISRTVKDQWDKGNYEAPVPITWYVAPNEDANDRRLEAKYLPFASCHYETGSSDGPGAGTLREGKFLRESGFRTFPIMAPRWDVTGEDTYGTDCPGMTALGDVKQLQIEERRKGQAIAKMVDPPLVGPVALRASKTSLLPGDVTYVDAREGMQGLRSIHDVQINLEHLRGDIGEVQYRIQRAFYEDLFLMIAQSDQRLGADRPTAREVDERHEEKLMALGPVLDRTTDELHDPIIDRAFGLMEAAGMLPEAPDELDGVKLKIEYTSVMAQAQKLIGVVAQDRFLTSAMGLAQVAPDALDRVDFGYAVESYGDLYGVDPKLLRTKEQADALGQARAQQQQAAMAAEQADKVAGALQKAGNTPAGGDTALSRMVGAA